MATMERTIADVQADLAETIADKKAAKEAATAADKHFTNRIAKLERERALALNGCNPEETALAESVLEVRGLRSDSAEGAFDAALTAIANGGADLRTRFIGAKRYDRFHQRDDCEYGYGPRHGSTVFKVGLKPEVRKREGDSALTREESAAAIKYLMARG